MIYKDDEEKKKRIVEIVRYFFNQSSSEVRKRKDLDFTDKADIQGRLNAEFNGLTGERL